MVWEDFAPLLPQMMVVLNARKLVTSRADDPAFQLFTKHPSPEQLHSVCNEEDLEHVADQRAGAVEVFQWYNNRYLYPSIDPDYNFLLVNIGNKLNVKDASFDYQFQSTLTQLALRTAPQSHQGSFVDKTKDRLLEYYRWVARGRKDDQFQFITGKLTANKPSPPANGSVRIEAARGAYDEFEVLAIWRQVTEICCPDLVSKGLTLLGCTFCAIYHAEGLKTSMKYSCNYHSALRFGLSHREECAELGKVYRVSKLLTDILHYFELRACGLTIVSVNEADGIIVVQEKDPRFNDPHGSQPLRPTRAATQDQWRIVSGEFASPDWYYVTQILTNFLLSYAVKKIHRMTFQPKNAYKTVQRTLPDGRPVFSMFQTHEILCLTTKSGIELAFDPTGARFGWRETLSPLADYISQRVHCVQWKVEVDPKQETFSTRLPVHPQTRRGRSLYNDIETARQVFYRLMVGEMAASQLRWLRNKDKTREWNFENILKSSGELFEELHKHSVKHIRKFVDAELESTFAEVILVL